MEEKLYGVWIVDERRFEDNAFMSYQDAMSLAYYCCTHDYIGPKNFIVVAVDDEEQPIWHEIAWCGQFQGFKWLEKKCEELEIISKFERPSDGG